MRRYSGARKQVMANKIKIFLAAIFVFAVAYGAWGFDSKTFITVAELREWIISFGVFAPLVFILMYGALATFGLPGIIASTVGGLVFGKLYGTAFNLFGATLGASGAFWIARLIARDYIENKFKKAPWFEALSEGVGKNGFYYMLFVRFMPVFPFNGSNFAAGVTNIRYRDFLGATMIGILPYDFALTNAVVEMGESVANGFQLSPGLLASLILLAFVSLAPIRIKKHLDARKNRATAEMSVE
jgi:uncharacterized membrane protein YdjX (TVP38/TMEM64 family)